MAKKKIAEKNAPAAEKQGVTVSTTVVPIDSIGKRLEREIEQLDKENTALDVARSQQSAKEPRNGSCGNPKCGRSLKQIETAYGSAKVREFFCSRLCRYEVTGEENQGTSPTSPVNGPSSKMSKPKAEPKSTEPKSTEPKSTEPRAPRAPKGSAVSGIVHISKPDHKFSGLRAQFFALAKEGMTAQSLVEAANAVGLDGKGILSKLVKVFQVIEIK